MKHQDMKWVLSAIDSKLQFHTDPHYYDHIKAQHNLWRSVREIEKRIDQIESPPIPPVPAMRPEDV